MSLFTTQVSRMRWVLKLSNSFISWLAEKLLVPTQVSAEPHPVTKWESGVELMTCSHGTSVGRLPNLPANSCKADSEAASSGSKGEEPEDKTSAKQRKRQKTLTDSSPEGKYSHKTNRVASKPRLELGDQNYQTKKSRSATNLHSWSEIAYTL